jgi:hypothetical protein
MANKYCPVCGDILFKVRYQPNTMPPFWQWECPEGDWFEWAGYDEEINSSEEFSNDLD